MPLETATYIHQLNPANPSGSDKVKDGDDHLRLLKTTLKNTFPGITGPLDPSITPAYLLGLAGGSVPFGSMVPTILAVAPAGWAICNGQTVPKSDGSGNITVPDLRGRVVMGLPIGGTIGNSLGATSKTVSATSGGSYDPAVTLAAAGGHSHTVPSTQVNVTEAESRIIPATGSVFIELPAQLATVATTTSAVADHNHAVTYSAHAGHSHSVTVDVTQPSMTFNIIIKI